MTLVLGAVPRGRPLGRRPNSQILPRPNGFPGLLPCFFAACVGLVAADGSTAEMRRSQQVQGDSLDATPDTLEVATSDSVGMAMSDATGVEEFVPRNVTARPDPVPVGWATGVWEWDSEALRGARALTVLELLEEVTGVVPLRGGDYGQPSSSSAFGGGAGRVRLYLDGMEMPPLDGGVVDLSRTGLAGVDRVRVERRPGELRVELFPLEFVDSRPYSFLEVGTGDLSTNLFRGVFGHPNALGGNILVALDRIDTQGPGRAEPASSAGAHVRHSVFRGERLGLAWEFRSMSSERPPDIWRPAKVGRKDWSVTSRYDWTDWLQLGAFMRRSSLSSDTTDIVGATVEDLVNRESRSQVGAHLSATRGGLWLDAEYRQQGGPGWATANQEIRGGATVTRLGGATFGTERQVWPGGLSSVTYHGRAWTRPVFGFVLFGEVQDGSLGVPFFVPPVISADPGEEPPEPVEEAPVIPPSFTQGNGVRVGLEYQRGSSRLGAAFLTIDADSLHGLGLPTDRGGAPSSGGIRSGVELSGTVPFNWPSDGLSVRGSVQRWDPAEGWSYLPERIYEGGLSLHNVFFESGNLELWVDVGARGRDPMSLPVGPLGAAEIVPFQQSWFARLQVRISSVRLFLRWENLSVRDMNQDYLGRIQPRTRSMYGVRWTMWN